MVRLREISRTAVFAWSPGAGAPLVVTGTRAGAVNEDFSSEIKLELWDLGLNKLVGDIELRTPAGSITTDAGFNDIAWSEPDDDHPLGVIAGALESGAVDLWDAQKLRDGSSDAFISRTTKHSGSAKALQWNPWRHNLLASAGAKGEIFIYDLNNMANPFRLGGAAARADDIECLDWNKQEKTAHILATGSSGGFVTVWDVKQKKDILTLNNQGRKAVSAVAWDPKESTKLATATPNDQDSLILLWSLRNSSAPERTLKGHELGVLGLAWCVQDPDLLLSCGKDNRTICWNPHTGEKYAEFAAGSNWAFQTRWNPHNPALVASASFDGKILVTSTQSTNVKEQEQGTAAQSLDGEDFFAKAQTQPQDINFNLLKAPKWAGRSSSASFGFGGKLVRLVTDASRKSKVVVDTFEADSSIGEATTSFEQKLTSGDMAGICAAKIEEAQTDEEKADWQVIEALNTGKSRKKLRQYLGFDDGTDTDLSKATEKLTVNGDAKADTNGNKDDDFFGNGEDSETFLADLAASKGAKVNNPFSVYTGSETEADKSITQALMLGQFEAALDICLKEDRMSDAFMIAVCGGQKCIDKAQAAYLRKKANGPNYLRLLASIVGKNLWDVVHNADIKDWKEVMATLCTYADEKEFSDLCEALGDRLEDSYQSGDGSKGLRRDASFCYLVGAKLEKVVINWVEEFKEQEKEALEKSASDNDFSVHAKCLQGFVEKVSVFRQVANFRDSELQAAADWKLAPLYSLYTEYADILASHGQLAIAERYLDLLPSKFSGADTAQQRIKQATRKPTARAQPAAAQRTAARGQPAVPASAFQQAAQPLQPVQPVHSLINQARNATPNQYAPTGVSSTPAASNPYAPSANAYAPAGYQGPQSGTPYGQPSYGGYQPPQQQAPLPPPPRAGNASPAVASPSQAKSMTNWNDMPEGFVEKRQPTPRRGTPAPNPVSSPFPNAQPNPLSPPPGPGSAYVAQKPAPSLPPPPRAGEAPQRVTSPLMAPHQSAQRPSSSAANAYAPPAQLQPTGSTLPAPAPPPVQRGASPYQPPPSVSTAAPSSRYAPAPGSQPSMTMGPGNMPLHRNVAPNPYQASQQAPFSAQSQPNTPYGQPSQATGPPQQTGPPPRAGPPPTGPPRSGPVTGPPPLNQTPAGGQRLPTPQGSPPASTPAPQAHPRGDRSHIPASSQPIVDLLTPEVARIKQVAPLAFKPQVDDMEKRINILFDHLNNQDLLRSDTVQQMVTISTHVQRKEWDQAQALFTEMQQTKLDTEGTLWMVGVKRLIAIGRATKS